MSWSPQDDNLQWRGGPARTTSTFGQSHWRVKRTVWTTRTANETAATSDKAVELISNCYRIKFGMPLPRFMHQYKLQISYLSSTGDLDEDSMPSHVKRMSPDKMPRDLKRQIAKLALKQCIDPSKEDWLYRLDQSCYTILYTNFDLLKACEAANDCQVNLPYYHGSKEQTLTYGVRFTKMHFDDPRKALNVILSTQDESSVVYQSAAQTSEFSSRQQDASIPIFSNVHLIHGNCINFKPFAVGSTLSISYSPALFYDPIKAPKKLTTVLTQDFKISDLDRELDPKVIDKLRALLVNRHIEVTYCRYGDTYRKFRVHDVVSSAYDSFNLTKYDTEISIIEHYKTKYGIELKYPKLPCIATDRSLRTMLPLELCQLCANEKLPDSLKDGLSSEDQYVLNRRSNKRPLDYFEQIEEYAKKTIETNESDLDKIGVTIERQPIRVMGTVIPPIWLAGADRDEPMVPKHGHYDARSAKFLRPIKMDKFCVTLIGNEETSTKQLSELEPEVLSKFIKEYCQTGQKKGVQVEAGQAMVEIIIDEKEDLLREKLKKHVEELNKLEVCHSIMVLPSNCTWIYAYLQYLETCFQFDANSSSGRRTRLSCLRLSNMCQIIGDSELKNQSFYQSLWSKYNAKLGGVNYTLKSNGSFELPGSEVLILGIHIGQKSLKMDQLYSIASVVGMSSLDNENYSCYTQLRAQQTFEEPHKSAIEQVMEIDVMLSSILESYANNHHEHKYPSKILVLREGVSASQFFMVENVELAQIKSMCQKKYAKVDQAEPKISCFIIQKRHDIRFKLNSPATVRDKETYNMPPGTIVDADAIRPDRFVFYSAQTPAVPNFATARPPFTCKVTNDIGYSSRQVQRLILALCYLSPRSCESTSVPTPVDLAEQASERGKNIALGWKESKLSSGAQSGDDNSTNRLNQLNDYFSKLGNDAYLNTLFFV